MKNFRSTFFFSFQVFKEVISLFPGLQGFWQGVSGNYDLWSYVCNVSFFSGCLQMCFLSLVFRSLHLMYLAMYVCSWRLVINLPAVHWDSWICSLKPFGIFAKAPAIISSANVHIISLWRTLFLLRFEACCLSWNLAPWGLKGKSDIIVYLGCSYYQRRSSIVS